MLDIPLIEKRKNMRCPVCGSQNHMIARTCEHCGRKLAAHIEIQGWIKH